MSPKPCLLAAVDGSTNTFTATAGMLQLQIVDISGITNLDTLDTSVFDVTVPNSYISVPFTATTTSLSFPIAKDKKYYISLTCVQLNDPFTAQAQLLETCSQVIDTISAVNLYPGYIIKGVA